MQCYYAILCTLWLIKYHVYYIWGPFRLSYYKEKENIT